MLKGNYDNLPQDLQRYRNTKKFYRKLTESFFVEGKKQQEKVIF